MPRSLGEEGRVDHVHRVGLHAQEAGEHGRDDRLLVELGRSALAVDRDARNDVVRELADQAAQLLGERHIGLELRRFLGREARHVERVGDAAGHQIVGELLGDLQRDIDLRFVGRGAQVRCGDEARRAEQRAVLGRLFREHVERGARDVAAVERRP